MVNSNIPIFVMEDKIVESLTKQIDDYMKQGVAPNTMELILYKAISYVQAKKCQGYANEYLKLMEENNKEESKDE